MSIKICTILLSNMLYFENFVLQCRQKIAAMTSYRGVEAADWFGFSRLRSQTVGYAKTANRIDSMNRKKTLCKSLAAAGLLFFMPQ